MSRPEHTAHLHIRCTPEERERWQEAARASGQTFSAWVRDTLAAASWRRRSEES